MIESNLRLVGSAAKSLFVLYVVVGMFGILLHAAFG